MYRTQYVVVTMEKCHILSQKMAKNSKYQKNIYKITEKLLQLCKLCSIMRVYDENYGVYINDHVHFLKRRNFHEESG